MNSSVYRPVQGCWSDCNSGLAAWQPIVSLGASDLKTLVNFTWRGSMKTRITHFSVHQNAKVIAVLFAVCSLVFFVPFVLIMAFATPDGVRPPIGMFLAMPVFYLISGYLSVAFGCYAYNRLQKYIGGLEFESGNAAPDAEHQ
jgi:hypothetical protein